jgi:hypothetical protein
MNPTHVVVSSGGARGLLALGAISELQRAGFLRDASSFAGTSIGAVIAAGLVLGRSPRRILEVAARRPLEAHVSPAHYGLDSGRGLHAWIRRVLGLRRPITLADVYAQTGKKLTICVCNLTDRKAEYWTHETHPNVSLTVALRISCTVPLVFSAVSFRGKLYVDGAVSNAVPVVDDPKRTLVLKFRSPPQPIRSMEDFLGALRTSGGSAAPVRYVVDIDPGALDPLHFALGDEAMREAYAQGRQQASRWVKKNV